MKVGTWLTHLAIDWAGASLDRLQLMLAGTGFQNLFGRTVSTEEFVEQFLELDDIVGKVIDLPFRRSRF